MIFLLNGRLVSEQYVRVTSLMLTSIVNECTFMLYSD